MQENDKNKCCIKNSLTTDDFSELSLKTLSRNKVLPLSSMKQTCLTYQKNMQSNFRKNKIDFVSFTAKPIMR